MKVGITGHTKGIGKSLFEKFSSEGHSVQGFSRSNGFDISSSFVLEKIFESCKNFDVFINNAYHPINQLRLLKLFCSNWQTENKKIINISSRFTNDQNEYSLSKKMLDDYCRSLIYKTPFIFNVKPGLTDTDRVISVRGKKMKVDTVANTIYENFFLEIKVHEITFGL